MIDKPCTHKYLASSNTCKILMCQKCGVVNLHLQSLSLHFRVEQFSEFAAAITEASKKIDSLSSESQRSRSPLALSH